MVVVTVNHQLVPYVTYPGGADDIQRAREWIHSNISKEKFGQGSIDKIILFGHSSGGAHIAMNLYAAGDQMRVPKQPIFPPVAGVIFLSVPFWFDRTKPLRQRVIRQYFGSDAEEVWGPLSPLGLFNRLPEDSPLLDSDKIPMYLGSVKWEIKETADATIAFFNAYRERSKPAGALPEFQVLDVHNHLRLVPLKRLSRLEFTAVIFFSNVLSIGTSDNAQGETLLGFIKSCVTKVESSQEGKPPVSPLYFGVDSTC